MDIIWLVYGNLISTNVKLNQTVGKGVEIGTWTFYRRKPNLYYELRFNLKPIDPVPMFKLGRQSRWKSVSFIIWKIAKEIYEESIEYFCERNRSCFWRKKFWSWFAVVIGGDGTLLRSFKHFIFRAQMYVIAMLEVWDFWLR